MSRSPQVGQIIAVRLGEEDYPGEVVAVTPEAITLAVRVEHDPASVLPATGSVTWSGRRKQAFGHAEMTCVTTVQITLPRPKATRPKLEQRLAVDVWEKPGSQNLVASGFTLALTGDQAELELNHPLPTDGHVDVALYLGKELLRIPAQVSAQKGNRVTVRFDPTAPTRSQLTRYIFAHLRQNRP